MSVVSNLFRRRDARRTPPGPVGCRPARRDETHVCLGMILGKKGNSAPNRDVLEFLRLAVTRRIDLNQMWLAERDNRPTWAILPILSPGRTMMLLCPAWPDEPITAQTLIEAVCHHYQSTGILLAQSLVDPSDTPLRDCLGACDFQPVAQLLYLERDVPPSFGHYLLPSPFTAQPFTPDLQQDFEKTVQVSYQDSQDCPELNGVRDIRDIMAGHRGTGRFDPKLWTLIRKNDRPIAVSLLNPLEDVSACELVYFAIIPDARGEGLGHLLMQHTLAKIAQSDHPRITLAVDARNAPAVHLYTRHGLNRVGSKLAMIRDLRPLSRR